ncbi:hypothetical protein BH10PSE4_BH10PSE4_48700 [soil metagenome]
MAPAYRALAICDRNSVAGIVRAHVAAKATGLRLIIGCELVLRDGMTVLVYPTDRPAYGRLCRLLSLGKARAGKGQCDLDLTDLAAYAQGLIAILVPDQADPLCAQQLKKLAAIFGPDAHMALTLRRRPGDALRLYELERLARAAGVIPVATNRVLFHDKDRRLLQDVVTCIREGTTIDDVGFKRDRHADRYLKAPEETLYEKQRRIALGAHLIGVDGRIQREGEVVHLVAYKLHDLGDLLATLQERGADTGDLSWARRSRNFC